VTVTKAGVEMAKWFNEGYGCRQRVFQFCHKDIQEQLPHHPGIL
jgi:hypothetical protein